jgi:hypothetical protein
MVKHELENTESDEADPLALAASIPSSLVGAFIGTLVAGPIGLLIGGVVGGGAGALITKSIELKAETTLR